MTNSSDARFLLVPESMAGMAEATLQNWRVRAGERFTKGQVIAEFENDKAVIEFEAECDGLIDEILVAAGPEAIPVGTRIARLRSADAGTVATPTGRDRIRSSPLARRMAREAGLDIAAIPASGPNGRLVRRDVERASERAVVRAQDRPAVNQDRPVVNARTEPAKDASGSSTLLPFDGMRAVIARRLTQSYQEAPHYSLNIDVRVDTLIATRHALNASRPQERVSLNDLVICAAAGALRQVPEANATVTGEGIVLHRHADIAVAVALDGGLITPIIRMADTKNTFAIAGEMRRLVERTRARTLKPDEFQGGTFSVSNLGMLGIRSFNSILNTPQACILSVGAAEPRAIVVDGALTVATMMTVTLTCDHRAVDGAVGARFLASFRQLIEAPADRDVAAEA